MLGVVGQAVGNTASRAGSVLHRLLRIVLVLMIGGAVAVAALAVRLREGPIELDWLARRLVAMANADDAAVRLEIGAVALSWEGWHGGIDRPIELVANAVRLRDGAGRVIAEVPRAGVSLSLAALVAGRVALRTVDLDGMRLRVTRAEDGTTTVDLGDIMPTPDAGTAEPAAPATLATLLRGLSAPPSEGPGFWGELRRVRLRGASATIADRQLGADWRAPWIDLDLTRLAEGGGSGRLSVTLAVGDDQVHAEATVALLPRDGGLALSASIDPVVPARMAAHAAKLAPLAAVDAAVALSGTLALDAGLGLRLATLRATAGAGGVHIGTGVMPIREAVLSAELRPTGLAARLDRLLLQARPDAAPTHVSASVTARRNDGVISADIVTDIDQVAFADLPVLWPEGVGGPGTRPWITHNVTAGTLDHGHVTLSLEAPDDFSDARLISIAGGAEGHDITGHWLRPVPPIEHGETRVVFVDPDTLDVLISAGTQSGTRLAIQSAKVRLTGIAGHDQFIAIDSQLQGPFADVVTLLRHPKIRLLERRPIELRDPAGQIATRLTVNLPLKNSLDLDNVAIRAVGRLTDGHAGGTAAGRDIDHANLDVDVGNDGLRLKGGAEVSGMPSVLDVAMDFRSGPPSQVLTRLSATASPTTRQLAAAGADPQGMLSGTLGLSLGLTQRRDGAGEVMVKADLARVAVDGSRIGWSKAAGTPGTVDVTATLARDRLVGISALRAEAPGLSVQASAELSGGAVSLVRLQRVAVGETTRLSGTVRLPPRAGQPYDIDVAGAGVDLSAVFDRQSPSRTELETRGPAFTVKARFDRVLLSAGRAITGVVAAVENDGLVTLSSHVTARAGDGAFTLSLAPRPGGRVLSGTASDAGALLRALDVTDDMRGGTMTLSGRYDDVKPGHVLTGAAEITGFRIQNAPAIARLLQALSLYGLLEMAQGPGLGFDRLVAPFSMTGGVLTLADARAYSASLGMTAKGTMDLGRHVAALEGTVIPIYALNAALGHLPVIGGLFSAEKEGGLLAVGYGITGPFKDPTVSVNPLSAVTPGILRRFFDMFDTPPSPQPGAADRAGGAVQDH